MTVKINIPTPSEVRADMNAKGLSAYRVSKGTGVAQSTISRFLNSNTVHVANIILITKFVNNYKTEK